MSGARSIAVGLVAVLLFASVVGANVVDTTEKTALNADFVSESLEEEGFYAEVANEEQNRTVDEIRGVDPRQSEEIPNELAVQELDAEQLANDAISEDYIRSAAKANIQRVFEYLHSDTDEVDLRIDTQGLNDNISAAVETQVENIDIAPLLDEASAEIENQPIDGALLGDMLESESQYNQITEDFQSRYTQSELDQIAQAAKQDARDRTESRLGQYAPGISEATIGMQEAMIDGLTDSSVDYDEFNRRFENSNERLGETVGDVAADQVDQQVSNEISTEDWFGSDLEQELQDVRGSVGTIDTLHLMLPLLSLVLIAVLYGISRSVRETAKVAGGVLIAAGIVSFLLSLLQESVLDRVMDQAGDSVERTTVLEALENMIEGVLGTLSAQGLVIAVAGLVLLGLAIADERGQFEGVKRQIGQTTGVDVGGQRPPAGQQPPQGQHAQQPPSGQPPAGQPGQQPPAGQTAQQPPQGGQPTGQQPQGGQPTGQQPPGGQPTGQQPPESEPEPRDGGQRDTPEESTDSASDDESGGADGSAGGNGE